VDALHRILDRHALGIVWFAEGCAVAAPLYYWIGFWCLALPVVVAVATAILTQAGLKFWRERGNSCRLLHCT